MVLAAALRETGEVLAEWRAHVAPAEMSGSYQWVPAGKGQITISPCSGRDGAPKVRIVEAGSYTRSLEIVNLVDEARLAYDDGTRALTFDLSEGHIDRLIHLFRE